MARQKIELAAEEAEELSRRARATTVSVRDRRRAEIIVLSAQGLTQQRIAEQLGISRVAVNRWVGRFALHRLDGLSDRAGRGRKPWLLHSAVQQVVEQAVTPPAHLGRWSCRTMARAAGISPASVQRLWTASDIKPHLSRTFKLSNDATRPISRSWKPARPKRSAGLPNSIAASTLAAPRGSSWNSLSSIKGPRYSALTANMSGQQIDAVPEF